MPDQRTSFTPRLQRSLDAAVLVLFGSLALGVAGVQIPPIVLWLASGAALVAATIAVTRLVRSAALRTTGNVLLTAAAIAAAVPVLLVILYFPGQALPVTSGEREAIASAENFVFRNGYTAAGHPSHLPVVDTDITDRERTPQETVKLRYGLVKAHAFGVVGTQWTGYDVLFDYAREPPEPARYFIVYVEANGDVLKAQSMQHTYPDWTIKRNAQ